MRYEFELSDVESANVMSTLERLGNRLMDIALVANKMEDFSREIRDLKADMKKMNQEGQDVKNDIREVRAMHKMLCGTVEDQQKMLENLEDSKKK